jgi:hypothetical protein
MYVASMNIIMRPILDIDVAFLGTARRVVEGLGRLAPGLNPDRGSSDAIDFIMHNLKLGAMCHM